MLAGAGGLIKSQNASLTLTGANTYSGITEIQAGELVFSTIGNVGGGASNLGAPITVQNGVIRTGLGASPVVLTYDGAGNSTNRIIEIQGTTGGLTINANGTGALNLGRIQTSTYGDKTLVLQGTSIGLNNSVEQILEDRSTLSVVKDGPRIWSFTGANANSYTGSTTVNQGTLRLTKTIPNAAIVGDSSAGNVDVVIMGGSLILAASEQLHNTVGLVLHAGSFSFSGSGLIETVSSFANTGGTFATGANTLIGQGATVTWAGGVNTISTGGQVIDKHWVIGGGVNTVEQGGELVVQSGGGPAGMFFTGTDSPTVTLDSSAGTAGRLLLKQDLVVDAGLTSGTAQILNGGAANNAGAVDLDGAVRAFSVHNGAAVVDLRISAQIHNGGIDKTGAGTLELRGPSAYELGTTVSAGTLLVNNLTGSGTGSGNVLVQPGAVLAGSGAIASTHGLASVRVQGMLDVGNVTDTEGQDFVVHLTGGASTINLDGTVRLDLWSGFSSGSLNPSPAADMLDATALSISIGSGSILTVEGANNVPGLWAYNSAWKLFNWGVVPSGEFGAINLPDLSGWDPMAAWDTSNLYTAGANGGTIMIVLAPEPGRALLMLLGLLGLGLRRRRSL